jgi:LPXTG-motif cell wall-anchored protein
MDESCFGEIMSAAECREAATTAVAGASVHDPQVDPKLAYTGIDAGGLAAIGLMLALLGFALLAFFGKARRQKARR